MKINRKVLIELNKVYSLAPLCIDGRNCFLAAAEKQDPCYLFSEDGEVLEKIWDGPGGVMTMEQVPGTDGCFLATFEFYSPNDGKNARIIIAERGPEGWKTRTLADLPMVHRFGILQRNGVSYLLACTVKNDYETRDDWRQPGAVYAAPLPEDLSPYSEAHQLRLYPVMAGLYRNHGFCKLPDTGEGECALIGSDEGVFHLTPPSERGGAWTIRHLLDTPASDAVLLDFDGDGQEELGIITPFHGDALEVYHITEEGSYALCYACPDPMEMLHATWPGIRKGRPVWFFGCRKGCMETRMLYYENGWKQELIDGHAGAANCLQLSENVLIAANHTIGQVCMYRLEED